MRPRRTAPSAMSDISAPQVPVERHQGAHAVGPPGANEPAYPVPTTISESTTRPSMDDFSTRST